MIPYDDSNNELIVAVKDIELLPAPVGAYNNI